MITIKKRIFKFFAAIFAIIICFSGLCACTDKNEPQKPDESTGDSYFLQKVDITGNDTVRVGGTAALTATASARNSSGKYITSSQGFTYISSAPSVATVDANGIVSGKKEGSCDITVKHEEFKAENKFSIQVVNTVELDITKGIGINTFGRAQIMDNELIFVNALSGFEVRFDGKELKGVFSSSSESGNGKNVLLVETDGKSEIIEFPSGEAEARITLASDLTSGIHKVRVYKLTDENHSSIRLISLSSDISYVTAPVHNEPKITVLGDHLTSGYGLGKGIDASKTYAFLAAEELNADLDILSAAGASLALGDNAVKDVWNHYSFKNGETYEGVGDSDYIVINLGENDARLIKNSSGALSEYVGGYKTMIASMRELNQKAKIICCYGMTPYSSVLAQPIRKLVKEIGAAGDKKVYALELERCDGKAIDAETGYPNAYGHEINAGILKNALEKLGVNQDLSSLQNKVEYDAEKPDISVIILGGQSNMEGNSWWKYLEGKDARYADYKNGFDGIKMSFANHESDAGKTPSFNAVKLGYGGARNPGNGGDGTTCFGPEIGMAKILHDNGYDNKVVFIKFAVGATYFHNDANNRNWKAKTGTIYKAFIQYVNACVASLSEDYNVSIDAMCWMQGESDTEQQAHVDAYKANLNGFVAELRKHFAGYCPHFMFYDAYINWPRDWQGDRPEQINGIKAQLAEENLHYEIIDVLKEKLHSYNEPYENIDLAHFDAESEIRLGEMFAEAYMQDFPVIR